MYKNNVLKLVCLLCCFSVISCDAMNINNVKKIVFASKNIFSKQFRKYSIEKMKHIYCVAYQFQIIHDEKFILNGAKKIYNELPTLEEKSNFLYFVSYHARGLRLVGDCADALCDVYGRNYSALVHEYLLEQYKEECKKEGKEYHFPGTYEKMYENVRNKK